MGDYVSARVTSANRLGISYYDEASGDLTYAERNSGQWLIEKVDTIGNVGRYTSLAFDGTDDPHISYYDATHYCLKYARRNGVEWAVTVVDTPNGIWDRIGKYTSIVLDSLGRPHISYHYVDWAGASFNGLKYAYWNGSEWLIQALTENLSGDWDSGIGSSIALDSEDHPHIAHLSLSGSFFTDGVYYATWNGVEWSNQVIDTLPFSSIASLSLDDADQPHVAYAGWSYWYDGVKYATMPTAVDDEGDIDSAKGRIFLNCCPNPFRTSTTITYVLPTRTEVCVKIYDASGRLINTLLDGNRKSGCYSIQWNGTNKLGNRVHSGVYFYRIEAPFSGSAWTGQTSVYTATRKLVVVR